MYSFLQKYGIQLSFGASALIVLLCVLVINAKSISYPKAYSQALEMDEVKNEAKAELKNELARENAKTIVQNSEISAVSPLLGFSEFLTVAGILLALIFPLYLMRDQKKQLIKLGAVLLGALVLWFVFYASANTEVKNIEGAYSAGDAKVTGALVGLIVLGVVAALGALVWGEINKIIQER